MSRSREKRTLTREVTEYVTTYSCDKCGLEISPDADCDEQYAQELIIALDQDTCARFYRQRDYCPTCLAPIWNAINELIGADPGEFRDAEHE